MPLCGALGGIGAALRSEIFLALRSRSLWAAVALAAVFASGRVALGKLQAVAREVERAARGTRAGGAIESNAYGPFTDGISSGLMIAFLLLVVLSTAAFALDRDRGTARVILTRRSSRAGLVLAKFSTLCLSGLAVFGAAVLASWAASALLYDFGPVVEDGYQIFSAREIRREIAFGLAAALVTLPATLALGLAVSAAARSAAEAVAGGVLLVLGYDALKGLLGDASSWIFLSYLPSLLDRSYLKEVSKLARGFSDAGFQDRERWLNLAVPLPEAALLLGAALWITSRRKM